MKICLLHALSLTLLHASHLASHGFLLSIRCAVRCAVRCVVRAQIGNDNFYEVLEKIRGPEAVAEWSKLQEVMRPLAKAAVLMPPVAFRWGRDSEHSRHSSS
jgi:hypothetical protein